MKLKQFLYTAAFLLVAIRGAAQPSPSVQPHAVYLDGVKAYINDDYPVAEKQFKQYIDLEPQKGEGYYYLSAIYVEQRRNVDALNTIKKAVQLDPENKWYKERYGYILQYNKEYTKAADVFFQLGQNEKLGESYLLNAALLYATADDYPKAIAALDAITNKYGYDEEIVLRKIQVYSKSKDDKAVEKLYQELIANDPKEPSNYSALASFYLDKKQTLNARTTIDQGLQAVPNDVSLQFLNAKYYEVQGDTAKYEALIKNIITNSRLDAGTQVSIFIPYLQQLGADSTKRQEGLALAAQLVTQHPDNVDVLGLYGDLLMFNEKTDSAAQIYKQVVAIDPSKFEAWQQLLFTYTERSKADSLIKYSDDALAYFPNQATIHYLNGIGKFNKGENIDAIRAVNRAIDLQADDKSTILSDMYSTLGDIQQAQKNYAESDKAYNKALELNPDNASVLNNYAYYLSLRNERLNDAEKMSKRSLELRPNEGTFLDTYGWILYKQGKYDQAKKFIEQAIKLSPSADGTLYEHLGDIYYKLGDTNAALKEWQIAKEKGVDDMPLLNKKITDRKLYE